MTAKLLELKRKITSLTLIPATGGCYELTVDGELMYSKLATDEFPNETELVAKVAAKARKT